MLFFRTFIDAAPSGGLGLCAAEPIPRTAIVGILNFGTGLMLQEEADALKDQGDHIIDRTAIRLVGDLFSHATGIGAEDYLNHAADPCLLYHCGILFARRDIAVGEELSVDYSLFLAERPQPVFTDAASGQAVNGLPPRAALLQSLERLRELLLEDGPVSPKSLPRGA